VNKIEIKKLLRNQIFTRNKTKLKKVKKRVNNFSEGFKPVAKKLRLKIVGRPKVECGWMGGRKSCQMDCVQRSKI
jgi:hypothetical protein